MVIRQLDGPSCRRCAACGFVFYIVDNEWDILKLTCFFIFLPSGGRIFGEMGRGRGVLRGVLGCRMKNFLFLFRLIFSCFVLFWIFF